MSKVTEIATEAKRIQTAKSDIKTAIENKGVTVGDGTIDTYAQKISEISGGSSDSWYDTFWDNYQNYGNRTDYYYGFANVDWNDTIFKPKYDMYPTTCNAMFRATGITDLVTALKNSGVVLDTSKSESFSNGFAYSKCITHIGEINTTSASNINDAFRNTPSLTTIDMVVLKEDGSQTMTRAFNTTPVLQSIKFEGVIGTSVSFADCSLLNDKSVQNIIDKLKDLKGNTSQTLTFHKTVGGNLTDEQKAIITAKNWGLVY